VLVTGAGRRDKASTTRHEMVIGAAASPTTVRRAGPLVQGQGHECLHECFC